MTSTPDFERQHRPRWPRPGQVVSLFVSNGTELEATLLEINCHKSSESPHCSEIEIHVSVFSTFGLEASRIFAYCVASFIYLYFLIASHSVFGYSNKWHLSSTRSCMYVMRFPDLSAECCLSLTENCRAKIKGCQAQKQLKKEGAISVYLLSKMKRVPHYMVSSVSRGSNDVY